MRIWLTDGAPLRLTMDHPVALWNESSVRWVEAGELRVGQQVMVADPHTCSAAAQPIAAIERTGEGHDVFDLTVDTVHNLFADSILAHNKMI
jgi:intein/homing endonuclease